MSHADIGSASKYQTEPSSRIDEWICSVDLFLEQDSSRVGEDVFSSGYGLCSIQNPVFRLSEKTKESKRLNNALTLGCSNVSRNVSIDSTRCAYCCP